MKFYLGKSVVRIFLLALFVTCVGFFLTTGQASAHSDWQGGCDNHGHNNGCDGYGYGYGSGYYGNVSDNCDSWDPKTGFCLHWRLYIPGAQNQSGGACDAWDSHTGNCTHWSNNSSDNNNSYHSSYYDQNYHDANYYYRYYCDRYHCNCS